MKGTKYDFSVNSNSLENPNQYYNYFKNQFKQSEKDKRKSPEMKSNSACK